MKVFLTPIGVAVAIGAFWVIDRYEMKKEIEGVTERARVDVRECMQKLGGMEYRRVLTDGSHPNRVINAFHGDKALEECERIAGLDLSGAMFTFCERSW